MSTEAVKDPGKINVLGYSYPRIYGISNYFDNWAPLEIRAPRLYELYEGRRIMVRRELHRSGYKLREIASIEQPSVSEEAIRKSVLGVERAPLIARLRKVFPSGGPSLDIDRIIPVSLDFMMDLNRTEIAAKYGINMNYLEGRRKRLFKQGFPVPGLREEIGLWTLQRSDEWIGLRNGVLKAIGKRLRTHGVLYNGLVELGFDVQQRPVHGGVCYYMKRDDIDRLVEIHEIHPKIFVETKTWSPRRISI